MMPNDEKIGLLTIVVAVVAIIATIYGLSLDPIQ